MTFRLDERDTPADPPTNREKRGDMLDLVRITTQVLDDCRIANGALVVAPSHLRSYPVSAADGMTCRPGETLPLAIAAMDGLGRNERSAVLGWLTDRAAGFNDDGYLRRAYAIHGRITDRRPDRLGTALLLWAICARPERATDEAIRAVVRQLAAGLALGRDRRQTSPSPTVDLAESALSALALHTVSAVLPADEWERAAAREEARRDGLMDSVRNHLTTADGRTDHFSVDDLTARESVETGPRRLFPDDGTDRAAQVALSWVPGVDAGLRRTILERLSVDPASQRGHRDAVGLVPVVHLFWLAIAWERAGDSSRADDLFRSAVELADSNGHFPEWVQGPETADHPAIPFLPAHLAFLLAAGVLGRLRDLRRSGSPLAERAEPED